MDILFTIFAFLIVVGIVIAVHEGGHFFTALTCKIKILEFSIGFGPKIYQRKFGKDEILFTLRAFPLGGYVKPLDKNSMSDEEWNKVSEEDKKRALTFSPRWKKALMVLGGPLSNFVLAFFVFLIALTIVGNKGLPPIIGEILPESIVARSGLVQGDVITQINNKKINFSNEANAIIATAIVNGEKLNLHTARNTIHYVDFSQLDLRKLNNDLSKLTGLYFQGPIGDVVIKEVTRGGVAEKAGLRSGDIISSINGVKTKDMNKILRIIRDNPEKPVDIEYIRDGKKYIKTIVLDKSYDAGIRVGKLNVIISTNENNYKSVRIGLIDGILNSFEKVVTSTWTTLVSIKKLFAGELSLDAVSGPISIAYYSGKSAQNGLYSYLSMIASISIAIGVFNLLPIPMLDGGHLLQYTIEAVRRKDFTIHQLHKIQFIGFLFMISLLIFVTINDVNKYLGF